MGGSESKPWREIDLLPNIDAWNKQTENKLRETCLNGQNSLKILMLGPTQNGKSSLVNSLISSLNERIMQCCIASKSESSITSSLNSPHARVKGERLRFKLTDMPGFFQGMPYAEDYLKAVLAGHINEGVVVPEGPLSTNASYYNKTPIPADRPCCVVLVMKASLVLDEGIKQKFQFVINTAQSFRLKVIIVLTHVDNLEGGKGQKLTGKNVSGLFHEEAVHKAVLQASQDTGLTLSFIHPVVNYTHEMQTITEMNILHLYTLSRMLELAEEGLYCRRR